MTQHVLFSSAIDYVRTLNDNIVDNALGKRSSYLLLPSLYQRAFVLCHETGEMPMTANILAPNERVKPRQGINIISAPTRTGQTTRTGT